MLLKVGLKIRNFLFHRNEIKYEKYVMYHFKKKSLKWCRKTLTKQQEKEIQDFYLKHLGRKVDTAYHRYFYSRNGFFSPRYIPTYVYQSQIIGRLNDMRMKSSYADKNQYERLFPQVKQPKTILKCVNGFYHQDDRPISKEEAILLCGNLQEAIIKPSLETSRGDHVACISTKDGKLKNGKSVEALFNVYGKNFIVQERIKQHAKMSALNPTSVNTIRILTYRRGNDIEILYGVIRIGRKGKVVDNESSGGITTQINKDSSLPKYAYGAPFEKPFETTDSGVVLDGYQIPSYEKVEELVKELHLQLPFFKLAGWDIAIGEDDDPIFIEWNPRADLSQTTVGPAFGDFTEEILEIARTQPNTRLYEIGETKFVDIEKNEVASFLR